MKDVHHRYPADGDVALCGSDLLVAAAGTMVTDGKDQTSFTSKYAVSLKPMPDEYTQQHAKIKWWDHLIVRISNVPGLTQVANNLTPAPVSAIVDVSLDDAPLLPLSDPGYERRLQFRTRTEAQNKANMIQRYNIWMDLRTGLFASIYNSAEDTDPIFAQTLYEACDYRRLNLLDGHFDGQLAFKLTHAHLFGETRSKADIEFYDTAKDIQKKSKLPDGCKSTDFKKKAKAWIQHIRPNLQQPFTDADAAQFIVDMLPKRLAGDGRRIKAELIKDGTFEQLNHLVEVLSQIVFEDQSTSGPTPSFLSTTVGGDIASQFDLLELSKMCGMALVAAGKKPPGGRGADGKTKWCDSCPHKGFDGAFRDCLANPTKGGTWPPSVHCNADRKKAFMAARAKWAKEKGITNAPMADPTPDAIEKWKKRSADRRSGGRGKGKAGAGAGLGTEEESPAVAGGAAVSSFYSNLKDITASDLGFCASCAPSGDDGQFDDPDSDSGGDGLSLSVALAGADIASDDAGDSGINWYVVEGPGGLSLRGITDISEADFGEMPSIYYGKDEDGARAYIEARKAKAEGGILKPPPTPSAGASTSAASPSESPSQFATPGLRQISVKNRSLPAIAPPPPLPDAPHIGVGKSNVSLSLQAGGAISASAGLTASVAASKMGDTFGLAAPPPRPPDTPAVKAAAPEPPPAVMPQRTLPRTAKPHREQLADKGVSLAAYERLLAEYRSTLDPGDLEAGDEMGSEIGFTGHGAFEMFILKTLAEEQGKRLSRYFSFSIGDRSDPNTVYIKMPDAGNTFNLLPLPSYGLTPAPDLKPSIKVLGPSKGTVDFAKALLSSQPETLTEGATLDGFEVVRGDDGPPPPGSVTLERRVAPDGTVTVTQVTNDDNSEPSRKAHAGLAGGQRLTPRQEARARELIKEEALVPPVAAADGEQARASRDGNPPSSYSPPLDAALRREPRRTQASAQDLRPEPPERPEGGASTRRADETTRECLSSAASSTLGFASSIRDAALATYNGWSRAHSVLCAFLSISLLVAGGAYAATGATTIAFAAGGMTFGVINDVQVNGADRLAHLVEQFVDAVERFPVAATLVALLIFLAGARACPARSAHASPTSMALVAPSETLGSLSISTLELESPHIPFSIPNSKNDTRVLLTAPRAKAKSSTLGFFQLAHPRPVRGYFSFFDNEISNAFAFSRYESQSNASNVGYALDNACAISPPPTPPASPPPLGSSGAGADDHYGSMGKSPPRADWLTAEQADSLFVELLAGNDQPEGLPDSAKSLIIADTGCGRSMANHPDHFEGELRNKKSSVIGVSGSMPLSKCGDMRLPLPTFAPATDICVYRESGSLYNPKCPFVLWAVGRASIEQGLSISMPAWGGDCVAEWPNGVCVGIFNRNVLVVRPIGYKVNPRVSLASITASDIGVPEEGPYGVYVASGIRRDGDIGWHLNGTVHTICIDKAINPIMNLLNPDLISLLLEVVGDDRCEFLFESLDCRTWTAVLFQPDAGGNLGRPWRDAHHREGIPFEDGTLPRRVREANYITNAGADLAMRATSHGARFGSETPAARGDGQGGLVTAAAPTDGLVGAEKHVYMYDMPSWVTMIQSIGATVIVIDQCRFLDFDPATSNSSSAEKATALLFCPLAMPTARNVFCDSNTSVGMRCNHEKGVHKSLRGFRTSGSECYSSLLCKSIAMCLSAKFAASTGMLASGTFAEYTFVAGVIYGKRLKREAITSEFIHRVFGPHGEHRRLCKLHEALSDVEPFWADILRDGPCEDCLQGDAPKIGHRGHLPEVEGLWFVDVHHTQIGTLWFNEKSTIGFKHSTSGLFRSWRGLKSQAPEIFELAFAYANSNGSPITWIHCDQANDLKGSKIVPIVQKHSCRITTTTLESSNQNPIEPVWRVIMKGVRILLKQGNMPLQAWGVAWDDCEEGYNLYPSRQPPHACPLGRFLGEKPSGTHRRPLFCLCYPTIAPRLPSGTLVNKAAVQAPRALCFGYHGARCGSFEAIGIDRSKPGYACFVATDDASCGRHYSGRVVVTPDVRFVPDCFPGLQRQAGGGGSFLRHVFRSSPKAHKCRRVLKSRRAPISTTPTTTRRPSARGSSTKRGCTEF